MSTRYTRSVLAATVMTCAFAGWGSRTAIASDDKMPVTAIGCLQSEREYRRQHESSKFAGTGYGLNDEYVLIDAVIGGPSLNIEPVTEQEANCVTGRGSGQAFELTGHGEDDLSAFLGRRVAIHGMLKHAKHDVGPVGTSGTFTPVPTGGGPSLGSDLELREINVESASLVPIRVIAEAAPVIHGAPEEPAPAPVAEAPAPAPQAPAPVAPAPQAPVAPLPKTASAVPTIGLIGLLSLACGGGLYLFNRRRARFA
jgi:LPXTG-motif cell wall-anchored protein